MFTQDEIRAYAQTAEIKRILSTAENVFNCSKNAVVAVSSAQRGEGKTLTSIALAIAALVTHRSYKRVLLMDLNWHEPAVHEYFNVNFAEADSGRTRQKLDELTVGTKLKGLDVLVPGHSVIRSSMEYDNHFDFAREMVAQARLQYDLTIIDTRAIIPVNKDIRIDPIKICRAADAVIVVSMAAQTPRQEIKKAIKMLETSDVKNIGVVLNQFKNPIY
jgi:Mrp family chromosome partitioning ATPase